jgi:hypothetical protein
MYSSGYEADESIFVILAKFFSAKEDVLMSKYVLGIVLYLFRFFILDYHGDIADSRCHTLRVRTLHNNSPKVGKKTGLPEFNFGPRYCSIPSSDLQFM